jgi:hypothetical protein
MVAGGLNNVRSRLATNNGRGQHFTMVSVALNYDRSFSIDLSFPQ